MAARGARPEQVEGRGREVSRRDQGEGWRRREPGGQRHRRRSGPGVQPCTGELQLCQGHDQQREEGGGGGDPCGDQRGRRRHGVRLEHDAPLPEVRTAPAHLRGYARHRSPAHQPEEPGHPCQLHGRTPRQRLEPRGHRQRGRYRGPGLRPVVQPLQQRAGKAQQQGWPWEAVVRRLHGPSRGAQLRPAEEDLRGLPRPGSAVRQAGVGREQDRGPASQHPPGPAQWPAARRRGNLFGAAELAAEVRGGHPQRRADVAGRGEFGHRSLRPNGLCPERGLLPQVQSRRLCQPSPAARRGRHPEHSGRLWESSQSGGQGPRGHVPRGGAVRGGQGHALRERGGPGVVCRQLRVFGQE
mmetsp:Transcript_14584/g.45087  ORF Transcript_14584/g.45087 Transcript_14584/m.45087 type:complete len:355 (+) Transcript_14584:116-1180(+)